MISWVMTKCRRVVLSPSLNVFTYILHGISPPFCVGFPVLSWAPRASTNCCTLSKFPLTPLFFSFWVVSTHALICLILLMDGFVSLIFIYRVFSSNLLYLKFYVDPESRSCWQSRKICQQLPNVKQDVLKTSYNFEGGISFQWESTHCNQT